MGFDWNKGLSKETDERVRRQSESLKARWKIFPHTCIGRECSDKTRELLRQRAIEQFETKGHPCNGTKPTEETRQKIRESVKKNWKGGSKKGVKKPKVSEVRKKLFQEGVLKPMCGINNPMYGRSGEKSPNWRGGVSFEPYCPKFNKVLKEKIRERDNRTCQLCGIKENGKKLDVHHIHYDKPNCNPDLIALCRHCHSKVNKNRNYYENLFMNMLNDKELLFWTTRAL